MISKIIKSTPFIVAFILGIFLYLPSMNGTPIWDDIYFWFEDYIVNPQFRYSEIFFRYAWPISVSLQKFLFHLINKNYFVYHLLNYLLHFMNSILVYLIARKFSLKYPLFIFLLFFFHPSNVITAAWMIQIKTLICFLFAFLSLLFFLYQDRNKYYIILSWVSFALSVYSKSSSITLPIILFGLHFYEKKLKKIYLLLPFLLLSIMAGYRVLSSPLTNSQLKSIKKVSVHELMYSNKGEDIRQNVTISQSSIPRDNTIKFLSPNNIFPRSFHNFSFNFFLQTLRYYLWQSLIPLYNSPLKGLQSNPFSFFDFLQIIFFFNVCYLTWKKKPFYLLIASQILLIPFLGLIPAPYMNLTWVSDQHLYLALPLLISFWSSLLDLIKWKNVKYFYCLPILFNMIMTYQTTPIYKNQFNFFENCIAFNPTNVPIILNLAMARIEVGEVEKASDLIGDAIELSQINEDMKRNPYFPYLVRLYFYLNKRKDANED